MKHFLASILALAVTILMPTAEADDIRHSYLVMGARTAIIGEDGKVEWEYHRGSRDGFVLPNGNVLLAFSDRVEEVTRDGKQVFLYKLAAPNKEIGTTQRLYNGNTLVTELGPKPRLLEIRPDGTQAHEVVLQPETDNAHMQTRMARQLRNGNYLVPHLLAFSIKEYSPDGTVVSTLRTDFEELGGRPAENWPFTAIRLDNGHTVASLTHGNKVIELNGKGEVVWKVTNEDVKGLFKALWISTTRQRQHRRRQPRREHGYLDGRSHSREADCLDQRPSPRRRSPPLPNPHHQRPPGTRHAVEVKVWPIVKHRKA